MRIVIAAVGRLKQGPERELAAEYRKRAEAIHGCEFAFRTLLQAADRGDDDAHDSYTARTADE